MGGGKEGGRKEQGKEEGKEGARRFWEEQGGRGERKE